MTRDIEIENNDEDQMVRSNFIELLVCIVIEHLLDQIKEYFKTDFNSRVLENADIYNTIFSSTHSIQQY
jgi:hypothetical protein